MKNEEKFEQLKHSKNMTEEEKEKYISEQIDMLIASDYSYDIIAKLLGVPLERVLKIS